jgi:drug/metabolite transporter (DMT)-like permease
MTPQALALVLAAAVCHATWNLLAKKAGGSGNHFVLLSSLLTVTLWAPLGLWAGLTEAGPWGWAAWLALAASAAVHILYFRTLLHGYTVADLTVVYPVARGSGPLLSCAAAVVLLGETVTLTGLVGALGVVAGVCLIAGGPGLLRQVHEPAQRQRVLRGLRWGGLTGAFIAGYTVIDGYAVKVLLISPILVDYIGNALRIPVMLPFALRDPAAFKATCRTQWRGALAVAALGPLSYIMVLYAVRMAPLSHVAPAREVSMLFAALVGGTLLGEGDRRLRLTGAASIAAGVVALAWG